MSQAYINAVELLLVLMISLVYSLIFTVILRNFGPWGSFWSFNVVLFLTLWTFTIVSGRAYRQDTAGYLGIVLAAGLIISLLLSAANHPPKNGRLRSLKKTREISLRPGPEEKNRLLKMNTYFWLLLFALSIAVIVAYFSKTSTYG